MWFGIWGFDRIREIVELEFGGSWVGEWLFLICDKSYQIASAFTKFLFSSPSLVLFTMSSRFANRRKPRKIGGSDEEDDGAAPGEWAASTLFIPRDLLCIQC